MYLDLCKFHVKLNSKFHFNWNCLPTSTVSRGWCYSLASTSGFHLVLHSLSCCAYCLSTRALSWKQATISLHAWKESSVRRTVRW